ncbi:hypothetical protein [Streptomyces sp. NPDC056632]|uniref:hypothetical protein n=1 Tax=Streptomyces sp. NPDC056632 TaxID=3345884 RepID=UPI0036B0936F
MDHEWRVRLVRWGFLAAVLVVGIAAQYVWVRHLGPFMRRHVVVRARVEFRRLASRLTAHVVEPAHSVLPDVVSGLPPHEGLADLCVSRWSRSFLRGIPARMLLAALLATAVWREADIRQAWTQPEADSLDPLASLIKGCVDAVRWLVFVVPAQLPGTAVRIWEHPTESVGLLRTPIVFLLLCWALFALLPGFLALLGLSSLLPRRDRRRLQAESEVRNWPVVLLMLSAVQCGRTHMQLREQGPLDLQRVSVRRAERVIRRAWKTRHMETRRHQRQELRAHAARVVGALRLAEARQHQDPDEALRTLATLLTTVTHRYAEGRVGQLLDERQLAGADPIADRSWIRLAVSGALIVVALLALARAGLPEVATGPIAALVITAVVAGVHRGRLPGFHDLIDIVRGADRR